VVLGGFGLSSLFQEQYTQFTLEQNHQHYLNQSLLSIYPIRGGRYRDTYDRGFKRGFMGYIGLLLNAPYKIDSIVWMRLVLISFVVVFSFFLFFCWLYEPRGILGMWALK
jgi:hypothetical protein